MKNIITSIIICVLSLTNLSAQQESHYTQFMYNKTLVNPAFTGARRVHSIYGLYRNQWIGYKGNPKSYLASYDGPLKGDRLGIGMMVANQEMGITKNQFANLMFSYGIISTEKMSVRVGLNTTLRRYNFDINNPSVYIAEPNDPTLKITDLSQRNYINVGMGVYFDYKNYYLGLSVPNLNKNLIGIGVNSASTKPAEEKRHVYLMTGGLVPLTTGLELKPSIMVKYVQHAPISADINLNVLIKRRITLGASYRYGQSGGAGDSVDALAFFQATNKLGIGLAYDFTVSGLKNYVNGSVEVLMRYDFTTTKASDKKGEVKNLQLDKNTLSNPRFFF